MGANMEPGTEEFAARLRRGPSMLFIGQRYLRLETGVDAFLSEIVRKYEVKAGSRLGYHQLLDCAAAQAGEAALAWMDERCRRLSVPDWVRTVGEYQWNSVYTSAIDSVWPASFRNPWRDIRSIFEERYKPGDPRNQFLLNCTFLFGCVNQTDDERRPPLTTFEWRKRKQVAVALARRIPETTTPMGTLVIEGYAWKEDWLDLDDLLPIVDGLNAGQTHVFSCTPSVTEHPDVKTLAGKGKLVLHRESLAAALVKGRDLGFLRLGVRPEEESAGRRIEVSGRPVSVPRDLWLQVSRSGLVLDDTTLIQPRPLSQDSLYRDFRNFLSGAEGQPDWQAYARGFAFSRDFEKDLRRAVDLKLSEKQLQDEPIILHGQTGTGKTMALAALAYSVRAERQVPIIFIERRSQRPVPSDIDSFCKWAEDMGARTCLVLWDGMVERREYSDILGYLSSRGRKVVLVGTCYRIDEAEAKGTRFVLAPAELSEPELTRFGAFLERFHPSLRELPTRAKGTHDGTFLVALYRLLPPTRSLIRAGVSREVDHAEKQIARNVAEIPQPVRERGTLAQALYESGIIGPEAFSAAESVRSARERLTNVEDLTGLVMVPGRFGLRVPLELLIRALGKNGFADFHDLFKAVDIFRWTEDALGNVEVGARNRLEAELVIQSRMGGTKTEVAFARRELLEVHDTDSGLQESREITFAVELVHAMGPQGRDKVLFKPFFKDIASTLRELREERGVLNPRLMLQEANLLREWAIDQSARGLSDADIGRAFSEAEGVLRRAAADLKDERKNSPLRNFLLVELAATLAAEARHNKEQPKESLRLFGEARRALLEARALFPYDYHPIDVLYWATRDLMDSDVLDDAGKSEAAADLLHTLQSVEPEDFDAEQRDRFLARRLEFGQRYNLNELADEAFDALSAEGSGTGYYLRALYMSGLPETSRNLGTGVPSPLRRALKYLEQNHEKVSRDPRCMDLMLDLWWMVNTKSRFFEGERQTLPLDEGHWRECYDTLMTLESLGESQRPSLLLFLRGLSLFHLGDFGQAVEVFREVERISDRIRGRRRIVRSYLASTPAGAPAKFHGSVIWVSAESRNGQVYVEEMRRKIVFLPRDFGRPEIAPGDSLGEFHIGFNFLGPVADPPSHHVQLRRE